MKYIFIPDIELEGMNVCDEYKKWVENWLFEINENIEKESISSSECIQGLLCEKLLGKETIDWKTVEKDLLRDENNNPLAYSEEYGKKLYNFDAQWKQMPVYAIYNSFWINYYYGEVDLLKYQTLVQNLIQPSGWIFNPEVSNTQLRTRMKSELMMSLAMGTEILFHDKLNNSIKNRFEATLASTPLTGYVSAEFFRVKALDNIGSTYQFPEGIKVMLEKCEAGEGYNDFCVSDKIDDYMGTRKRTQHDTAIHTPLISNMAYVLSSFGDEDLAELVSNRMHRYSDKLKSNPMDIPAFTMRDIEYPFGTSVTPLEIISAVIITNKY